MKKTVTCSTLVRLRDVPHEAGTVFTVVDDPKAATEVDPTTAARWAMNGWLIEAGRKPATVAASEGA